MRGYAALAPKIGAWLAKREVASPSRFGFPSRPRTARPWEPARDVTSCDLCGGSASATPLKGFRAPENHDEGLSRPCDHSPGLSRPGTHASEPSGSDTMTGAFMPLRPLA